MFKRRFRRYGLGNYYKRVVGGFEDEDDDVDEDAGFGVRGGHEFRGG